MVLGLSICYMKEQCSDGGDGGDGRIVMVLECPTNRHMIGCMAVSVCCLEGSSNGVPRSSRLAWFNNVELTD